MSGTNGVEGQTLADFFRFDPARVQASLKALERSEDLTRARALPPGFRGMAADSLIQLARVLLNSPLGDALGDSWAKWRELEAASNESRLDPEKVFEHTVADHEIALVRRPKAEVQVNGRSIGLDIYFELKLGLTLEGAVLKIQRGEIIGAQIARLNGAGVFRCGDVVLAERKSGNFNLPGVIPFVPGVPIGAS